VLHAGRCLLEYFSEMKLWHSLISQSYIIIIIILLLYVCVFTPSCTILHCLRTCAAILSGGNYRSTQREDRLHSISLIWFDYIIHSCRWCHIPVCCVACISPQVEWKSLLRSRCGYIGGWGEGIDKNLFQKMISTYYLLWCSPIFLRTLPSLPSALYEIIDAHIVMSNHSRSADCWYLSWLRRVVCIL
jgi:hypothetical protein